MSMGVKLRGNPKRNVMKLTPISTEEDKRTPVNDIG